MISAASRSSVLRSSSTARPSGRRMRKLARNISAPVNGSPSTPLDEFLDVDAEAGQRLGDVAHDARPFVADDRQRDQPLARRRGGRDARRNRHPEAGGLEPGERRSERLELLLRRGDQHDSGEFAGEAGEAALEPGPARARDALRDRVDQPRPVAADEREHQRRRHLVSSRARLEYEPAQIGVVGEVADMRLDIGARRWRYARRSGRAR